MNVYLTGTRNSVGIHKMFIQPGNEKDVADWKDDDGNAKLMEIVFVNGKAEVDSNIGEYLLSNKLASRSRLILPN